MIKELIKLYKDGKEFFLLELGFFTLSVISFAVAGIVALFSQALGLKILIVPLVTFIVGLINIVAWAVIKLIVDSLSQNPKK